MAARYRAGLGNKILSTYNNAATAEMIYKWSPCGSPAMKRLEGSAEIEAAVELRAWPNPFSSSMQLQLPEHDGPVDVQIINLDGKVVRQWQHLGAGIQQLTWEAADVAPGLYLIRCNSEAGTQTLRIQKTE